MPIACALVALAVIVGVALLIRNRRKKANDHPVNVFYVCRQCEHPYFLPNVPLRCRRCDGPVEKQFTH